MFSVSVNINAILFGDLPGVYAMNLTSRSRYALKIMLDLAAHRNSAVVRRQEIVNRQGVPAKYLDQILVRLRRDGLVFSVRGRTGGYRLAKDPDLVSIWDIFRAVEDGIYPVECVDEHMPCAFQASCVANEPWQVIFSALRSRLEAMSLASCAQQMDDHSMACGAAGIRECKPGREPFRVPFILS